MLRTVIHKHSKAILLGFQYHLEHAANKAFADPGVVSLVFDGLQFPIGPERPLT